MKYFNIALGLVFMLSSLACKKEIKRVPTNTAKTAVSFSGTWVTNVASDALDSRENIKKTVATCKASGIGNIFVVVWNQGRTLYPSDVMQTNFGADARKKCISDLAEAIPRLLDNERLEIPFKTLTDTIGSLTPASAQEIRIALQGAMKNKEIIVTNQNGNSRSSAAQINGEDIIKYHQRQFIFL